MSLFESERARLGREHLNLHSIQSEGDGSSARSAFAFRSVLACACRGLFWDSLKQEGLKTPVKKVCVPLPWHVALPPQSQGTQVASIFWCAQPLHLRLATLG